MISPDGDITVTNDGATILGQMQVSALVPFEAEHARTKEVAREGTGLPRWGVEWVDRVFVAMRRDRVGWRSRYEVVEMGTRS